MVQIKLKGVIGVESPSPRSFWCGSADEANVCGIAEKETCICGGKKDLQKKYSSKRDVHMWKKKGPSKEMYVWSRRGIHTHKKCKCVETNLQKKT